MRYLVTVSYTFSKTFEKELMIYAPSPEEAEEKAVELINGWDNIEEGSAEVIEIEADE